MSVLLEIRGVTKHFNGVKALDNVNCAIHPGEIVGLIGPNGAGKTTLFNTITGFLEPDEGEMIFRGSRITRSAPHKIARLGISRTFQEMRLIRQMTVLENVLLWFGHQTGETICGAFLRWKSVRRSENQMNHEARALLETAGLLDKAEGMASDLSYGQQKLLSIICCLASKADLLLFDEPIAGIAPEMAKQITDLILQLPLSGKTVIMIEHNMDVVMNTCKRVIFMDEGAIVCEGAPDEVRRDPRVIEAYLS